MKEVTHGYPGSWTCEFPRVRRRLPEKRNHQDRCRWRPFRRSGLLRPAVRQCRQARRRRRQRQGWHQRARLELFIEDDQCKPELATNTAAKLVSSNVIAVIGHICSGATKAALGIYKDSKIVTISPSATNPPLTQSGEYPNFFRTIAPDDAQAKLATMFIKDKLGLKTLAVLHDKGDYGKGFAELVKQFAEAEGIEVVLFEGVNPGAPDYSAVVNKIGNSGARRRRLGRIPPRGLQARPADEGQGHEPSLHLR